MDIGVFIDWQNVYRQARKAFDLEHEPTERGIITPLLAAKTLAGRNARGDTANLVCVEIHRGLPDPRSEPKANRAVLRHRDAWLAEDPIVAPRLRALRLNKGTQKTEEKGVDVALAISALEHMIDGSCEVVIVFSHDSDLQPLLEAICRLRGPLPSFAGS